MTRHRHSSFTFIMVRYIRLIEVKERLTSSLRIDNMRFVGWLVYFVLGTIVLYLIVAFIENTIDIDRWTALMRGVFIIGLIGWGAFLAWWVNQD